MSSSFSSRRGADDRAVTEVLGQVLTFGLTSIVVIGSLLAFGPVRDRAEARVARVEAEGAAAQVAAAVSQAARLAGMGATEARIRVDLPEDIAGRSYSVTLDLDMAAHVDTVRVEVDGLSVVATAPLFGVQFVDLDAVLAGQQPACSHTVSGTALEVVLGVPPPGLAFRLDGDAANADSIVAPPGACTSGETTIFLEDTL